MLTWRVYTCSSRSSQTQSDTPHLVLVSRIFEASSPSWCDDSTMSLWWIRSCVRECEDAHGWGASTQRGGGEGSSGRPQKATDDFQICSTRQMLTRKTGKATRRCSRPSASIRCDGGGLRALDIVKMLLSRGADPLLANHKEITPMYHVAEFEGTDVINMLFAALPAALNMGNRTKGSTALGNAVDSDVLCSVAGRRQYGSSSFAGGY